MNPTSALDIAQEIRASLARIFWDEAYGLQGIHEAERLTNQLIELLVTKDDGDKE